AAARVRALRLRVRGAGAGAPGHPVRRPARRARPGDPAGGAAVGTPRTAALELAEDLCPPGDRTPDRVPRRVGVVDGLEGVVSTGDVDDLDVAAGVAAAREQVVGAGHDPVEVVL